MKTEPWKIRPQYISMVNRYDEEKNLANKIEMKHKFVDWIKEHHTDLTDAELEYLQASICMVEDIYF